LAESVLDGKKKRACMIRRIMAQPETEC
jgi:hypothetical protein